VLETDVRLTKDEHLIIFHDDDLSAVTESSNSVRNLTISELNKLDFAYQFRDAQSGEHIWRYKNVKFPRLDAFLSVYWSLDESQDSQIEWIPVNIELKDDEILAAQKLAEEVMKYPMDKVAKYLNVVSRFCAPLDAFRKATHGRVPTASCEQEAALFFITTRLQTLLSPVVPKSVVDYVAQRFFGREPAVEGHEFSNLQLPTSLAGGAISVASEDVIERAHSMGKEVHFWVINTVSDMQKLLKLKADSVITDRTDVAVKVFEELGRKPKQHTSRLPPGYNPVYSIPVKDLEEPHECVGLLCVAIEHSRTILVIAVAACILISAFMCVSCWGQCCRGREHKQVKRD